MKTQFKSRKHTRTDARGFVPGLSIPTFLGGSKSFAMRSDVASAINLHFGYGFPDVLSLVSFFSELTAEEGARQFVKLSSPMGSRSGKARRDEGIGTGQGAA